MEIAKRIALLLCIPLGVAAGMTLGLADILLGGAPAGTVRL